jgi:hypothetical protein
VSIHRIEKSDPFKSTKRLTGRGDRRETGPVLKNSHSIVGVDSPIAIGVSEQTAANNRIANSGAAGQRLLDTREIRQNPQRIRLVVVAIAVGVVK